MMDRHLLHVSNLVAIDGVVMFDGVHFGHREGNSKSHYGYREGLHGTVLEDFHAGLNGSLIPERGLGVIVDSNDPDYKTEHQTKERHSPANHFANNIDVVSVLKVEAIGHPTSYDSLCE